MSNLKNIAVVVLRIQAACFIIMALIQWVVIAAMLLVASLKSDQGQLENFEFMLIFGGLYFFAGFVLFAASRFIARVLLSGIEEGADE